MLLDILAQLKPGHFATFGEGGLTLQARHRRELREHRVQEESQPNAFTFTVITHQIHAIVPVTGAHQRQAVFAQPESSLNRSHTMLVQAGRLARPARKIIVRVVLGIERAAFEEMNRLIQHPGVAGRQYIAARRQWQPKVIIRTMRAHAPARGGMPPMLDISLQELPACAQQQLLAQPLRLGVHERHRILQLIAKAKGAPRLVVPAARPKTACQRLVHQPAVGQHVQRLVGCFYLHGAQRAIPVLVNRIECGARGGRSPEAMHHLAGLIGVPPSYQAEPEYDLALLPVGQLEADLDCGAGIERRSHLAGKARTGHRCGILERAVTPDEFSAVAACGPGRIVHIVERNQTGELRVVRVTRKQCATVGVDFGGYVHGRFRSQISQHPLHVTGR